MSEETQSTSAAPVNTTRPQGANPVQRIETRGENDFTKQITEQGGAEKPGHVETPAKVDGAEKTTDAKTDAKTETAAAPATPDHSKLISDVVSATVAGMSKKDQAQVKVDRKELTQDEFNKKYSVVTIDEGVMARILDADPKKGAAALNTIIQGAVRQALLMSQDLGESALEKIRGEFKPHIESWQQFQARQHEEEVGKLFDREHPDLKDEKDLVEEMTAAMLTHVKSGKVTFKTQTEANKAVADACRKILAKTKSQSTTNGSGSGAGASAQTSSRTMSAASSAGRSGTGQAKEKSDVELVFGNDAR